VIRQTVRVISRAPQVRIVHLTAATFGALADGDLAAAEQASPVPLSPYFAGPDWAPVWRIRHAQVLADPASAAWVTGVIWDDVRSVAAGRAGFHGPPDPAGMVEIGYAVVPELRGQGYAAAALTTLLDRSAREPGVRTVRLSIAPANDVSRRLALRHGFREVGMQIDDEDGPEIVYERQPPVR
jgi:RimJ/RimL family protein N-acetyltransferase